MLTKGIFIFYHYQTFFCTVLDPVRVKYGHCRIMWSSWKMEIDKNEEFFDSVTNGKNFVVSGYNGSNSILELNQRILVTNSQTKWNRFKTCWTIRSFWIWKNISWLQIPPIGQWFNMLCLQSCSYRCAPKTWKIPVAYSQGNKRWKLTSLGEIRTWTLFLT